ncbi:type VI secretion system protein TssA [Enterobacter bugandensis]|jgi:type VI secretion-associated protein, VC_A0119 family|uniref:type VI secretion system protein TssA n=1 Tax=Enterobacter bugandensis TaxID=881260 RepID=UPI002FD74DCF
MTLNNHPWLQRILAPLSEEKTTAKVNEESPLWEVVDSGIARLGSLTHEQVDIPCIQENCLILLEQESKDFRIVIHLLRTLQHGGHPEQVVLAGVLLTEYLRHFASVAWPQDARIRVRLLQQVLRRFEGVSGYFSRQCDEAERKQFRETMVVLSEMLCSFDATLSSEVSSLMQIFDRSANAASVRKEEEKLQPKPAVSSLTPAAAAGYEIATDSERAWRQSLLKVADLLCESHPAEPVGYLVRRHAIWGNLNSAPASKDGIRTQLAAVSPDRVSDYRNRMTTDPQVWKEIETSLTLAPWWFDGHYFSSQRAEQCGYHDVAQAIRESVAKLIKRLPGIEQMQFSDGTPFASPDTCLWIMDAEKESEHHELALNDNESLWQEFHQNGLQAALSKLDDIQKKGTRADPRFYFYNQLTTARLLEEAGLSELAQHQFCSLWKSIRTFSLEEWEPSLMTFLKKYISDTSQGLE